MDHISSVFHDNFSGFTCWGDFILGEFQNQFCTYSAFPEKKCESGLLFDTNMPAVLQVGDFVIVTTIIIKYMLRLLITYIL